MRIGVLFNCQTHGLVNSLRRLMPSADIRGYAIPGMGGRPDLQAQAAEELRHADLVISSPVAPAFGKLSRAQLEPEVKRFYLLPAVGFTGFHPDTVYVYDGANVVRGPTGPYHSRLAMGAYLAGLTPDQTVDLFNRLVLGRLGYFREFGVQCGLLAQNFAKSGIDVTPLIPRWLERGCFMHSVNHPHIRVLFSIAQAVAAHLNLPVEAPDATDDGLPDDLSHQPTQAMLPEIAQSIGVPPFGIHHGGHPPGGTPLALTLEDVVTASFAAFDAASERVLLQAAGVETVFTALGTRRRPRPAPLPRPAALLTWHGGVLRQRPGGLLETLDLEVQPTGPGQDVILPLPPRLDGAERSLPDLGGVAIQPSGRPHAILLRRDGRYLCAELERPDAAFTRAAGSDWESFLPVEPALLALLRRLVGRPWRNLRTGEHLPAGLVRVLPGFRLQLGPYEVALNQGQVLREAPHAGQIELLVHNQIHTLAPEAEAETPAHARAATAAPPATAILQPGQAVTLEGPPEPLHLPLTASQESRLWLAQAAERLLPFGGTRRLSDFVLRGPAWLPDGAIPPDAIPPDAIPPDAGPAAEDARTVSHTGTPAGPTMPLVLLGRASTLQNPALEQALQLHVLAPFQDPDAKLVIPQGAPPDDGLRQALGLNLPIHAASQTPRLAPDVLRLGRLSMAGLPAIALEDFRNRALHHIKLRAGVARFYLPGANPTLAAQMATALDPAGFIPIQLSRLTQPERIALFATASFIVGPDGPDLAYLLFAQPGTKLITLTAKSAFSPSHWIAAEQLGLHTGVLPISPQGADPHELTALVRMLRQFG